MILAMSSGITSPSATGLKSGSTSRQSRIFEEMTREGCG
jgi:hypothetical protein